MGNSRDREFIRWGVHEIGSSEDGEFRKWSSQDGELMRWGVEEMGSSADGKFTR